MLASEQLKQQMAEAEQIAREKAESKKKKPESKASSAERTELDGRAPDLTGGIDIKALRFPANVMMANSSSSLGIGNQYSNSMDVSGVIRRLVVMPGGFVYGLVSTGAGGRWVIAFPTGMTAELEP